MNLLHSIVSATVLISAVGNTLAQGLPSFTNHAFADQSYIERISDNGQWALAQPALSDSEKDPKLINLATGEITDLNLSQAQLAYDVTDNGQLIVGQSRGVAAVYTTKEGNTSWFTLPSKLPTTKPTGWSSAAGATNSKAVAVTPDGTFAVGCYYQNDGYLSVPALWNIRQNQGIALSGLPTKDMSHQDQGMMTFNAISADGKYILGCMSYSYVPSGDDLGGCCYFIYDRTAQSYKMIGFTESDTQRWSPKVAGLEMLDAQAMSPNGKYVTGTCTVYASSEDTEGGEYTFLYDVEADQLTVYNAQSDLEGCGYAVTNDGVVLLSTPNSSPVRNWYIRSNNYWYGIAEVYKQQYGTTFSAATQLSNTGTLNNVSADGKTIAAFPDPYGSYVMQFDRPVSELCQGMTLLGSHTVSPAEGSALSRIAKLTLSFPYPVQLLGSTKSVLLKRADGTTQANSIGITVSNSTASVTFRASNTTMLEGQQYSIVVPAGTFGYEHDATQTNQEIVIGYNGRSDAPVQVVECYPAEGSSVIDFNNSTSYVQLTYNAEVLLADGAKAYLYRNQESEPLTQLRIDCSGRKIAIYPTYDMNFYKENTYTIQVPAGVVTDLGGNNPSEAFSVTYQGGFERTVTADDINLFTETFSNGTGSFLLYDGDLLVPTQEMEELDFYQGLPWSIAIDDAGDNNVVASSHSCYIPAGKSDDWMVTPQLFIPDQFCSLDFLSQSYRQNKQDYLKVVVWVCDKQYNELTTAIVDQIKAEGTVVYNELQSAGEVENKLAGEWRQNHIDLAPYAGQNIYIGFVNENENQSVVFVDDVQVLHNMKYLVTFTTPSSVVAQESVTIAGKVIGYNADKTYTTMSLTLKDAAGNTLDTYTASGLSLGKNQGADFSFTQPLSLQMGTANKYSVVCNLDGDCNEVSGIVKNLAFEPVRRVVIEEFTGVTCGNCPLGIVGIEKAEAQYGDLIVPISIHTYQGDPWSNGQSSYNEFLGMQAAPSGRINREAISYPAVSEQFADKVRYYFRQAESETVTEPLWLDYIDQALRTPADCDVTCEALYNSATQSFDATVSLRYALHATEVNVSLYVLLLEDHVQGIQQNYLYAYESDDVGEWSKGKSKGKSVVSPVFHNDVVLAHWGATFNGTAGLFPTTVEAGTAYSTQLSVPVPSFAKNVENCKLAALLIDPASGKIVNATTSKIAPNAIQEVESETQAPTAIFNLSGMRIDQITAPGLYVRNGKIIMIR